jgi:hypothetical protein
MATLVFVSGRNQGTELQLKPGLNRIGRDATNDLSINDPSVSGSHCELMFEAGAILVNDLGSTNGTFIDQNPVQEGTLCSGQTLQLGTVEMRLEAPELGPSSESNRPTAPRIEIPIPRPINAGRTSHPAVKALQLPASIQKESKGFFGELPGAFQYPFKKDGVLLLVAGTLFFAFLNFLARYAFLLALPIMIFSGGYLASHLQAIITSTAQGEDELPKWPDFSDFWQDIVIPFFQMLATALLCFGPALILPIVAGEHPVISALLFVLGALYFPMGVTAVSIAQSISGLNPLFIIASILKVPLQYLVTCLILGVVFAIHMVSDIYLPQIFGRIPVITNVLTGFVSLYFLTVEMRILGLLYFTNRNKLQWI